MINHALIYYSYINMHICIHFVCFFPHGFLVRKKVRYDNRHDFLQVKWVPILWQAKGVQTTTDRFRCRRCRVLKIDIEEEYSHGGGRRGLMTLGLFRPQRRQPGRRPELMTLGLFRLTWPGLMTLGLFRSQRRQPKRLRPNRVAPTK